MLPVPDQIAELRHKDEIDRAVAKHLIRDRNIATSRVRDRRDLHSRSLTPRQAWGNESGSLPDKHNTDSAPRQSPGRVLQPKDLICGSRRREGVKT